MRRPLLPGVARLLGPLLLATLLSSTPACTRRLTTPDPAPPTRGAGWYETQADEGFSFAMPAPPEVQRQNVPTEAGPLPVVMYLHEDEGAAFNVTTALYPEGFMDHRAPAEVLAGARDGAAANISGEILEQREVQLFAPDGGIAPGLEILMRTPEALLYRGRIFIVGPRLIQLSYVTPEATGSEETYRHFVESFILTPPPGQP